jgi:hypothetical protein
VVALNRFRNFEKHEPFRWLDLKPVAQICCACARLHIALLQRLIRPHGSPHGGVLAVLSDVGYWHKTDLRIAAPEGPITSGLPTLDAECLVSGGKPTVI